jgi:hypothetical protein
VSDLRKLLWRVRTGYLRHSALEDAIEEACEDLVNLRFEENGSMMEVSQYSRPFLARFEEEVARARLWAPEGEAYRAVRAVEGAALALEEARRITQAHEVLEETSMYWVRLQGRFELQAVRDLLTLREVPRLLKLVETFLEDGESHKARFAMQFSRARIETLTALDRSPSRRRAMLTRTQGLETPTLDSLAQVTQKLIEEGLMNLAERLLEDWEVGEEPPSPTGVEGPMPALQNIRAAAAEAQSLQRTLEALVPSPPDEEGTPEDTEPESNVGG